MIILVLKLGLSIYAMDDISENIRAKVDAINLLLNNLDNKRKKLEFISAQKQQSNGKKEEEKLVSLLYINSTRSSEYNNLIKPFQMFMKKEETNLNSEQNIYFLSQGFSPIYVFKPQEISIVNYIYISNQKFKKCLPKQILFEFYYKNEIIKKSKVIDIYQNESLKIQIDLNYNILFDKIKINVIQNWGDNYLTCLPKFKLFGPKNQ